METDETQSTAKLATAFDIEIETKLVHLRQISEVKNFANFAPRMIVNVQSA